jgi:DNA-binding response OmpR family regulator
MHVVLVEDNKVLAKSVNAVLAHEGYATTLFDNGQEAYAWLRDNSSGYDLVILDVLLPDMNGFEICRQLRLDTVMVPILILTSKGALADTTHGLDCGADDYLKKPFVFDELLARIRALGRRLPNLIDAKAQLTPDVLVDFQSRTVLKRDEPVHLTAKEFNILLYFVSHPNKLITQQEIYDHVFDFAEVQLSNTIEVHIKNIRKKLKTEVELPLVTVRNAGYRLEYEK